MAFVLVGEPGNGKTFFVDSVCSLYRRFMVRDDNRRYTFTFTNIDLLENYGRIRGIQPQTFEDPMVLAMNLFPSRQESITYLSSTYGFSDQELKGISPITGPWARAATISSMTSGTQ
jgi:serine protein kinase